MIEVSIIPRMVVSASVGQRKDIDVSLPESKTLVKNIYPDYAGITDIVPSDTEQTIEAKDTVLRSNIRVAAIPSNYGKIEFDGSKLRIV